MKKADIENVSAFSRAFARHFREWATDHGLTQVAIARESDRTQAWVSERLRGVRPVDTDLIAVVARMSETQPRDLVEHILAEMGRGTVTKLPDRRERPTPAIQKRAARKAPSKPKIGDE